MDNVFLMLESVKSDHRNHHKLFSSIKKELRETFSHLVQFIGGPVPGPHLLFLLFPSVNIMSIFAKSKVSSVCLIQYNYTRPDYILVLEE